MSNVSSRKYRRGTATLLSFPTMPSLTMQPRRVDLYQKQYTHDIMVLEFPSDSTLWFDTLKTGVPVQFSWRQDTQYKNWIGYVSSISKVNAPQRTNLMQIVCVGATFVLKDRATRVFRDATVPEAISKIAREYGFNVIADNHPQRFSQLAVTGSSYWEWINEQARRIGYGVIVDGMDFLLKPLDKLIDITFSSAPVLSLGNSSAPFNTDYLDRTLDEFRITYGDNVEDSKEFRTVKNVGGVDPISGKVLLSSSSPADNNDPLREDVSPVLFEEYRTDKVVNDPTAAKETSKAAAQLARFNIPALVKGQGDPRLRPFGAVFISGTGTTTDGFWIAREAHHMFHKIGDYMINMKIATDGVGDAVVETPFRTRDDLTAGTVNLEEAVANGEATRLSFELNEVELIKKNQADSEYNQGFTRTPDRWRKVR